jgi:hypothetical protein
MDKPPRTPKETDCAKTFIEKKAKKDKSKVFFMK